MGPVGALRPAVAVPATVLPIGAVAGLAAFGLATDLPAVAVFAAGAGTGYSLSGSV